ncbi:MAG: lipid-transfer protein, partial [Moraxellaceae bacterium]|nr:lipid-transfer protein [Moraxellaceae bacterium]
MKRRVNVIGVGMTKFAKPGSSPDYHEMAREAG